VKTIILLAGSGAAGWLGYLLQDQHFNARLAVLALMIVTYAGLMIHDNRLNTQESPDPVRDTVHSNIHQYYDAYPYLPGED
jgi:hypothetical protein